MWATDHGGAMGLGLKTSIAALAVTAALVIPTATAEPTAGLAARLDTAVTATLADLDVPGAIVGLSVPGQIDYLRAVGTVERDSGVPMSVDEHWRIGSVTKTFTGTAVLELVDRGLIALSDPISRYVDGVPFGGVITLDLLGRMRSGLVDYVEDEALLDRLYTESPAGPTVRVGTTRTGRHRLRASTELPTRYAVRVLEHQPGTARHGDREGHGPECRRLPGAECLRAGRSDADQLPGERCTARTLSARLHPCARRQGGRRHPVEPVVGRRGGQDRVELCRHEAVGNSRGDGRSGEPSVAGRTVQTTAVVPGGAGYGFAIMNANGWIGHNGDIPGYTTVVVYLPEHHATLVVMTNSDVPQDHAAGRLATVVTQIATPDAVYRLGPPPTGPPRN